MSFVSDIASHSATMMSGAHRMPHRADLSNLTSDVFKQLDTSGKGSVDAQTFLSALSQYTQSSSTQPTPAISQQDAQQFFGAMDSNADGQVTPDEMTSMFKQVSDQFQTRLHMQKDNASEQANEHATTNMMSGMLGHRPHRHDMMNMSEATSAVEQAANKATKGTETSQSVSDWWQRQLASMMRRYEQVSNNSVNATALAGSATNNAVSVAA